MDNLLLCLMFLVFIGYREFFIYKERQKLLDRIHSSNYIEFKKFDEPRKIEEKESKVKKHNWL